MTRPGWAGLVVVTSAAFLAITTEVLPIGLLPQIGAGLGVGTSAAGLLVSAYAAVVVLGSIPLTAALAHLPRRRVLAALLVVYAVTNLVLAATSTFAVALAARVAAGGAHAAFFSVVFSAATAMVGAGHAGRAVAAVSAGVTLALALGVPLGTALGVAVGWRWSFVLVALLLLVLAALVVVVVPAVTTAAPGAAGSVLTAARQGPVLAVAALVVIITLGHNAVFTYVTPLLVDAGVSVTGVPLVLLGYGLFGVLGTVLAGVVVTHHLSRALTGTVALLTATLLVLGLLGVLGAPTWATVATVVVWGAAFGTLPTLLQTAGLRAAPRSPDAGPAVVNTTFNIGIGGGALLGAGALRVTDTAVLALVGAVLAAGALVLLLTGRLRVVGAEVADRGTGSAPSGT